MMSTKDKFIERIDYHFEVEQKSLKHIVKNLKGIESDIQEIIKEVINFI
jgi:hypothetical protein